MATEISQAHELVRFERVTGTIGAWVSGVALDAQSTLIAEMLRRGLAEYGVLFFDFGRIPSSSEFTKFAGLFGEVEAVYGQRVANRDSETPYIDQARTPMSKYHSDWWHTDGLPLERPPLAALLTPLEVPEVGGDTMWSSMYAAWDALSPRYQRLLEGVEALNNNGRVGFLEPKQCIHPAVITDSITGRKALYINSIYTERLIGLTDRENDSLLRFLFEHVNTPEFHVRLRWRPGVVAVWHERVTQHRGVSDIVGARKLKRLTISGERPQAGKSSQTKAASSA
jgi:taurine dioxygenase